MAQASAKDTPEPAADNNVSEDERKNDAQSLGKLGEFLRRYVPHGTERKRDQLQDRYQIDLGMPLPEFDSKTARAYAASDSMEPTRMLFAQVCQPGTVQRHRVITLLQPVNHPNIVSLVAAGAVELSRPEEERFVIFYERPAGKKLSELLAAQQKPLSQQFICDRIIAPLAAAINQFSDLDISHGLVNPDNIYFKDFAMLGPCASESCGYSQPFYFESIERIQALPAAKGEGSTAQDYYALAVVVLYILHGPKHFASITSNSLIRSILREGVYTALTRNRDVPEIFYDFFRGMLSQSAVERWNYRHLKPWLEGKRYNVLPPPPPLEAIRPFEFGDEQANTRRELAQLFASDWDHIATPLQNHKLTHWVSVSLRNKDLAENVTRISRAVIEMGTKNEMQLNEQLMRVILLLDPQGPIRLKQLSLNIDGIDSLSAELYRTKAHQDLQLLAKFIELNMGSYWMEMYRKSNNETPIPTAINAMFMKLDKLRTSIRNTGYGFGLERLLYELNPEMPCLSPLLATVHVTTLPNLLKRLDKLAPTLSKDDPIDRHIAAFIASRLNLQHEIRLHDLTAIPSLASSRTMIALHLLASAQQRSGDVHVPGLTHWLAMRIVPLLDVIHSHTIRQTLKAKLIDQVQTGKLSQLAKLLIDNDYAVTDQTGFSQARALYQNNAMRINAYRQGTLLEAESARAGFMMAKALAYMALAFSIFGIFQGM